MARSQTNTVTFTDPLPSPRRIHPEEVEFLLTQEDFGTLVLAHKDSESHEVNHENGSLCAR